MRCAFLLLVLLAGFPTGVPASGPDLDARIRALFEATGELRRAGKGDSVLVRVDALEGEAVAAADTVALVALRTHRGRTQARMARFDAAEASLRAAVATAEAAGDSAALLEPIFRLVQAIDAQGRPPRVVPWMERLLALSLERGDEAYEGRIRALIARRALREARLDDARRDLERAHAIFARGGDLRSDLPSAQLLLGIVHVQRGEWDRARDWWQACADSSRAIGMPYMEANARTNLGQLEAAIGDPAAAAAAEEEAFRILSENGRLRAAIVPGIASAQHLSELGRTDDALARANAALERVRAQGLTDLEPSVLRTRAGIHRAGGDLAAALADARAAVAAARRDGAADVVVETTKSLATHLADDDSVDVALALLEREALPRTGEVDPSQSVSTRRLFAELLLRAGRAARAAAVIDAARHRADSLGLLSERVALAVLDLEARLARGGGEGLVTAADAAIATWESRRLVTTDPRWREVMGRWSPRLAEAVTRVFVERAEDPVAAWQRLQRLRTRTLLERMAGPVAADSLVVARPATLEELRERLGARALIEVLWGRDAVWVWVVDHDHLTVRRLDGAEGLGVRLQDLVALARDPDAAVDAATIVALGASLGRELLGAAADRPAWFVVDGPLVRVPPILLRPETSTAVLPSAAVLTAQGVAPRDTGARVLALSGRADAGGARLDGAMAEVDWLVTRTGASSSTTIPVDDALHDADVLHVAAHATADDRTPWRSGILLGDGAWWRAEAIATARAPVGLVVLSACRSAAGREVAGEGVLGLTQAFLAAGSGGVVASLWPVDDAATVAFTRAFYGALADGSAVESALGTAVEVLRSAPATAHPRHWAAWVPYGDARVRPAVALRRVVPWDVLTGGLLFAIGLALLGRIRARV